MSRPSCPSIRYGAVDLVVLQEDSSVHSNCFIGSFISFQRPPALSSLVPFLVTTPPST